MRKASLVAQMVKNLPAMRKTRVQFLGWEDPLEKGMATHSSTLAWEIPWIEEPGGLQSMGPQRVGHNKVTEHIQILKEGQFIFYLVNLKGKSNRLMKNHLKENI